MKSFHRSKKSGLTLIEVILALSVAAVVIVNVILFLAELSYKERLKITAGNIMTINSGLMRKIQHDGNDILRFVDPDNDGTVDISATDVGGISSGSYDQNYIYWDQDDYVDLFLNETMVPNEACDGSGTWIPKDSATGSAIRTVPLIPCGIYEDGLPFGLEFRGVLIKDSNPANYDEGIGRFTTFINFDNSEVYNRSGFLSGNTNQNANNIIQFMNYLEARQSADLYGTQSVELVRLDTAGDYMGGFQENVEPSDCFLSGGANTCEIAVHINFTGGNNQQFLRTDGTNGMLAPLSFTMSGADSRQGDMQTCARWVRNGANWEQDLVECGLHGGLGNSVEDNDADGFADEGGVKNVTSEVSTDGLYITYREPGRDEFDDGQYPYPNALCDVYPSPGGNFIDDLGVPSQVPCGIYNTSTDPTDPSVQVIADSQTIEDLYSQNIRAVDITARKLRVKEGADPEIFTLIDDADNSIYVVEDMGGNNFRFSATGNYVQNGNMFISQGLTVDGTTLLNDDLTVNGDVTFNLEDRFDINIASDGVGSSFDSYNYIDTTGYGVSGNYMSLGSTIGNGLFLTGSNTVIDGTQSVTIKSPEIITDGTLIVPDGSETYSEVSSFNGGDVQDYTTANAEQRSLRSFVTKDYVKHLENISSDIVLKYVNVATPTSSYMDKPNCLDFVNSDPENTELYAGTDAATNFGNGEDYARIMLLPISFKTYSNAYGSNQFYTHHAQDVSTGWEIYFYLSGDGAVGTGAREDGAGTSIAMVYCDYSSIDFRAP